MGRKNTKDKGRNVWTEDDSSDEDIKPDIEDFRCESRFHNQLLYSVKSQEIANILRKCIDIYKFLISGLELDQLDEMEKKLNKSRTKKARKKSKK